MYVYALPFSSLFEIFHQTWNLFSFGLSILWCQVADETHVMEGAMSTKSNGLMVYVVSGELKKLV